MRLFKGNKQVSIRVIGVLMVVYIVWIIGSYWKHENMIKFDRLITDLDGLIEEYSKPEYKI